MLFAWPSFVVFGGLGGECFEFCALIERAVRTAIAERATGPINLYPEDRACPAPSAPRLLTIFNNLTRHHLTCQDRIVQTFEPDLTSQQRDILALLGIPTSAYHPA